MTPAMLRVIPEPARACALMLARSTAVAALVALIARRVARRAVVALDGTGASPRSSGWPRLSAWTSC